MTDHDRILREASHVGDGAPRVTLQSAVSAPILALVHAHHALDHALKKLEIPIIVLTSGKFFFLWTPENIGFKDWRKGVFGIVYWFILFD